MTTELHKYLSSCAAVLASDEPFNLVIGNEAADLDSTISALIYGFLSSYPAFESSSSTPSHGSSASGARLTIPIINIPSADLPLRSDATYFLSRPSIATSFSKLFFTDNVPLRSLVSAGRIKEVVLVDHNKLSPSQEYLTPLVRGVIDHHADERIFCSSLVTSSSMSGDSDSETGSIQIPLYTVSPVASATTLVASHFIDLIQSLPLTLKQLLSELLLGPITVDSVNFDVKIGRVKELDLKIGKELAKNLIRDNQSNSSNGYVVADKNELTEERFTEITKNLFDSISKAKSDIQGLSVSDLLRRDYKSFESSFSPSSHLAKVEYGISSIPTSLSSLLTKSANHDTFMETLQSFQNNQGIVVLFLLNAYKDKEGMFRRELVVFNAKDQIVQRFCTELLGRTEMGLSEFSFHEVAIDSSKDITGIEKGMLRCFNVGNLKMSRKLVQPIVNEVFAKL
ncbi:DHHA2 domain-containing protein [Paraphysoderma sedebokerense]|nr:DHHA2 domain-containing protein [Paraphysoderma sedebokerense]